MRVYELGEVEGVRFDWVVLDTGEEDVVTIFGPEEEQGAPEIHALMRRSSFEFQLRAIPEFAEVPQ